MSIHMTAFAQPDYLKRLGVVRMMSLDFPFCSAFGAHRGPLQCLVSNSSVKSLASFECQRIPSVLGFNLIWILCSPLAQIFDILHSSLSTMEFVVRPTISLGSFGIFIGHW